MKAFLPAACMVATAACAVPAQPNRTATTPPPLAAAAPVAASAATATDGTATTPGAVDSREARLVARMLKRVERARGLQAAKTVPGVLLDRAALIARVKEHVARELPPEAIRNEGLSLQLLGFVPPLFDYEATEYKLLEDQLAGYYEPADRTMYMASDLADDEAEATLAHELVHALQDQRWDLDARSKYRPGDGDRSEAVSALAEGDATSAMFDVILARAAPGSGKTALDLPDDVFSEQIRQGMNHGPAGAAPLIMRSSLAAPYVYGTQFVNALRRRGGWDEVDRAWGDPPVTSEQVLHVDKWLAHEPPVPVEAPAFAALGAGWTVADQDSEGELGTRIAFAEWLDASAAAEASTGWGGDRSVLVTSGDRAAFAWRLRYDPEGPGVRRAARAFEAVTRGVDRRLGPPSMHDGSFECHERPALGPFAIGRKGDDLVFIAGPAHVSSPGNWTSAAGCSLARNWIREITSRP